MKPFRDNFTFSYFHVKVTVNPYVDFPLVSLIFHSEQVENGVPYRFFLFCFFVNLTPLPLLLLSAHNTQLTRDREILIFIF